MTKRSEEGETNPETIARPGGSADKGEPGAQNNTSGEKAGAPEKEYGGRSGPEPTRYGDWEKNGIISDF